MDRYDPNDWTPSFVSTEHEFCAQLLQKTCTTIIELVRNEQYEPAVAGLDHLINGMILMQNYAKYNYSSQISYCSWVEGEIVAFAVKNAPEEKRREVALKLFEDARDFAHSEKSVAAFSVMIRELRAKTPLSAIHAKYDPHFPDSVLEILEKVRSTLLPGAIASAPQRRSQAAPAAPSGKSRKGILPAVAVILCILCLGLFIWSRFTKPKEAVLDEPAPAETTTAPQTEATELPTEAPAATYVVKTESGNGLNLREGPGTDTDIITAMEEYSVVTVLEVQENWAFVSIGDLTGWCSMDYLVPEDSFSREDSEEAPISATVTTKSGELRLRTEPSLDSEVIDGIPKGTSVIVLRQEGDWCYVEYEGNRGWCSSEFLTFP